MACPTLGNRLLLPIELACESVRLAATGQRELRDMLLKQPLIGVCPARCATPVMPALRPIGDGQRFGACCDLTLDHAEMALRLGLRDFHAREQDTRPRSSIIAPSPGRMS
jgi:hypothetical protein